MIVTDTTYNPLVNNCLSADMAGFTKGYKAEYFIEDDINNRTRITHDAFVRVIETVNTDSWLVSVVIWDFSVNGQKPDLLLEQLAEKCRRPLENITFVVSKNWELTGIYNHAEILQRWKEVKQQLEDEYTGEIFEKYVALHEQVLYNPLVLLQKLKADTFLSQYFCGFYNAPFHNFILQGREQARFMNIDYNISTLFSIKENSEAGSTVIEKSINTFSDDYRLMPAEEYNAEYVLDDKNSIKSIFGSFKNYGRKFIFRIEVDDSIGN